MSRRRPRRGTIWICRSDARSPAPSVSWRSVKLPDALARRYPDKAVLATLWNVPVTALEGTVPHAPRPRSAIVLCIWPVYTYSSKAWSNGPSGCECRFEGIPQLLSQRQQLPGFSLGRPTPMSDATENWK